MKEISPHLVKVFEATKGSPRWMTAAEIADRTGVLSRTGTLYAAGVHAAGVLDRMEAFPAYLYRLAESPPEDAGTWSSDWDGPCRHRALGRPAPRSRPVH